MSFERPQASSTHIPVDVVVVTGVVVVTWMGISLLPADSVLRVPLAVLFVLVAPGYAIVAALFPAARVVTDSKGVERVDPKGLDFPERLALSVGTSIVVAPFVAFLLHFTTWGVSEGPVVFALGFLTLTAAGVAILRWRALAPRFRFRLSFQSSDWLLSVFVALVVIVATVSVAYTVTNQDIGEQFTEFYLLGVSDDGRLVGDDYPSRMVVGEANPIHVGLSNHEGGQRTYTVVVVIQEVDPENGVVLSQQELNRFQTTVDDSDSWGLTHDLTPTMAGLQLRVAYLLYEDGTPVPAVPSISTADDEVHIWVDVFQPELEGPTGPTDPAEPAEPTEPAGSSASSASSDSDATA